jgi:aminopeptidase YwaD
MLKYFIPFVLSWGLLESSKAQSFNTFYGNVVNECVYDSVYQNLIAFENLGIKEAGTAALTNTLTWLITKYQQYGYTDIVIDTFDYIGNEAYNLIVTKPGTTYPNNFVVVDGHYDSKTGTGTNDNGSGTAIILETARLLKNINTDYAIKFIHFSMEEVGLVGSYHFVNNVAFPNGMDIRVLLNIDEVGGDITKINNTIICERDESNPTAANAASYAFTDTLATCVQLYSNLFTEISYAYASDYMPFQAKDYVITGFFEKNQTPHRHQATDSIAYVDVPYVYEITKATIGSTMYFAVARDSANSINELDENKFSIYPNPANDRLTVQLNSENSLIQNLKIINLLGETIDEYKELNKNSTRINTNRLKAGIYFLIIESNKEVLKQKFIISK